MRHLKRFEEFLREGVVRRGSRDTERARSLAKESARKVSSLREKIEKIGIKDGNANDYVEYCYDIIMHLLRAKLCLEGYAVSGRGAHEAEVSYLRILGFEEKDVQFADQMRYFRNGILYYGKRLDQEYAEKVVRFLEVIYPKLRKMCE